VLGVEGGFKIRYNPDKLIERTNDHPSSESVAFELDGFGFNPLEAPVITKIA
jgi:hypothetical protein